jgi:hypothetical protein
MPQAAHVGSDSSPILPSYEDISSIGRALLADGSEHQVMFWVNFSVI